MSITTRSLLCRRQAGSHLPHPSSAVGLLTDELVACMDGDRIENRGAWEAHGIRATARRHFLLR